MVNNDVFDPKNLLTRTSPPTFSTIYKPSLGGCFRTRRFALKGESFKCPNDTSDETVKSMEEQIGQLIDNTNQDWPGSANHLINKQGNFIK